MRDRSKERGEACRWSWAPVISLAVLGCLWLGMGGCSDDDITFPGDVPPLTPTGAPTATPEDDEDV